MTSFNDDSYPEWAQASPRAREYYDFEWGRTLYEERELYELIALLGFQAGLNWSMVLNKRERLRERFHNFDPDAVAQFEIGERLTRDRKSTRLNSSHVSISYAVTVFYVPSLHDALPISRILRL